jgi:hypothetical protein
MNKLPEFLNTENPQISYLATLPVTPLFSNRSWVKMTSRPHHSGKTSILMPVWVRLRQKIHTIPYSSGFRL